MGTKIPLVFKPITPFIRRAEELDRDTSRGESALVAYYCRQYAMEVGIQLREKDTSDDSTKFLMDLMARLEKDKVRMGVFSMEEAQQVCESFAFDVFGKADDEDRAGSADKNTAKTFYAAGTFFDILKQFGNLGEEVIEKTRYCKWKAADILKALKEGRTPTPGPPGKDEAQAALAASTIDDIPQAPTGFSMQSEAPVYPPIPPSDGGEGFPNMAAASINVPVARADTSTPSTYHSPPVPHQHHQPPPKAYESKPPSQSHSSIQQESGTKAMKHKDAIEYAKFAIASIKANEIEFAIERLEHALRLLRG